MTTIQPKRLFWTLAAIWMATLAFFWLFPAIDIAFSDTFFFRWPCADGTTTRVCGQFVLGDFLLLKLLRSFLFYLPPLLALFLLLSLFVPSLNGLFKYPDGSRHNRLILLAAWIADSGIFVNMFLKAFSGRPRPADTLLFGGHLHFVPAGDFSGACTGNCSFVSGEAASAGWMLCLLALMPMVRRRHYFWKVFALSVLTALMRVAFGRHFISDAVLGWFSAIVVFVLLAAVFGWQSNSSGQGSVFRKN